MRTWTETELVNWIDNQKPEIKTILEGRMHAAFDAGMSDHEITNMFCEIRRRMEPTFGQKVLGLTALAFGMTMGAVAAWDAADVMVNLPKATRNMANK